MAEGGSGSQSSVDAGPTWALADAYDRPVWTWDGRGFVIERSFDGADRPVATIVRDGAALDAQVETISECGRSLGVSVTSCGVLGETSMRLFMAVVVTSTWSVEVLRRVTKDATRCRRVGARASGDEF